MSASLWELDEAGIQSMVDNGTTGYTVAMSGQSGTIRTVLTLCVVDTNQVGASTATSTYTATSAGATALSLARVAESLTLFVAYCQTASTLTLANPTRDVIFNDTSNGTQFNIGFEPDTLRTVDSTYSALGSPVSAFTVSIAPYVPSPHIATINGSATPTVADVQEGVSMVVEDLAALQNIDVGGSGWPGEDYSFGSGVYYFNFPPREDGRVFGNLPATKTVVVEDIFLVTAEMDVTVSLQDGEAKVVLTGANTTSPRYITYRLNLLGYSVADGCALYYPLLEGAGELVINPDGSVEIDSLQRVTVWHVDQATGIWNSFEVTMVNNEVVTIDKWALIEFIQPMKFIS